MTPARTRWDEQRDKQRGKGERVLPTCKVCGAVAVLSPCRSCAAPDVLELYPRAES